MINTNANKFKQSLLFLVRGDDEGQPAWYYILVKDRIRLELLQKQCSNSNNNVPLEEFGEILESGWGENPPDDVIEKVQKQFC